MTIQYTAFEREVVSITSSGERPIAAELVCTIHANGVDIPVLYVNELKVMRNYIKNFTDVVTIKIMISPGVLEYQVKPFKRSLEVTLRKLPMLEQISPGHDASGQIEAFRYRATLFDNKSKVLEANTVATSDQQTADRTDIVECQIQLYDPVIEYLRMQSVGGIFRNVKGISLVRYLLDHFSKAAKKETAIAVLGVTIAPNANQEVRDHIIIPHHTPFAKFPSVINRICGGIYPAGFQYYLQNQYWYLYAPYDVRAYATSHRTLTILNIPNGRLPNPERSYRVLPTQVIILSTGEVNHDDESEQRQLNLGNGTRFVDASRVMDGFLKVRGNRATAVKGDNINEFVSGPRDNKLNLVTESDSRITANYLTEYGKLAAREGALLHNVWENSDDKLLYPGMPVKFIYVQNNVVNELYGVLVGATSFTLPTNPSPKNRRFATNTALSIFVDKNVRFD